MATDRNGRTISTGDDYILVGKVVGVDDDCGKVLIDTGREITMVDASRIAYQDQLGGGSGGVSDHGLLTGLADDDHPQYMRKAQNLADVTDPSTARNNLGLGDAAVADIGTAGGTVAAGDHTHAQYRQTSAVLDDVADVVAPTPSSGQVLQWNGSAWVPGSAGGGVSDHGALTGLSDDDHPQYVQKSQNLADLANAATSRTNLGLGDSATRNVGDGIGDVAGGVHTHTLSDITDSGGAAALNVGTTTGTVAAGDHTHSIYVQKTANLSDLANAATARSNLGLGDAAVADIGTGETDVAAGDHLHAAYRLTSAVLNDVADVSAAAPGSGQVLQWNGSAWVPATVSGGGGGVTDHGALTGLADNDHPQYAQNADNLSGLASASTARTNLGLGGSATLNVGTTAGTVAAGDHGHTVYAQKSANLSDLANATTARTNLGLGNSATLNTGTAVGTVATGDHTHSTYLVKASNLADITNAGNARNNLGLGNAATRDVGTGSGDVATGDHTHTAYLSTSASIDDLSDVFTPTPSGGQVLQWDSVDARWEAATLPVTLAVASNLADLQSASAARDNLGLGNSATLDTGTTAGTVATGDHTHTLADVTDSGALAALDGLDLGDLDDVTIGSLLGGEQLQWNGSAWVSVIPTAYAPLVHTHTLSDVTDSGGAAALDVGTSAGTVAAGDHGHSDLDVLQSDGAALFGHRHAFFDDFISLDWWSGTSGGTGLQINSGPAQNSFIGTEEAIGVIRLTNSTGTAGTDYRVLRMDNVNTSTFEYDGGSGTWIVGWRVAVSHTANIRARVGVWSGTRTGTDDGAGFSFEFDTATNANVLCRKHDGTSASDTDSGVTVASFASTFRWCHMRLNSSGATFYIDGTSVATFTSSLPSGTDSYLYPQMAFAGAGATWRSLFIDAYAVACTTTNGIENLA